MRTILLDPGHGRDTAGKCSPDGLYHEWKTMRTLARRIMNRGKERGMDIRLLFDSDKDFPVSTRVAIANRFDPAKTILISLHSNAAGDGSGWHEASGFCAFLAPGACEVARRLAGALVREAICSGMSGNRAVPPSGFWTANLGICRRTLCPAVLTENLFHDNHNDLSVLMSDTGLDILADLHINALSRCFGI